MWSNQIKAVVRCSCFDLPEALKPPARQALNCYDGNAEQEAKGFLRSSQAFQSITSFYTPSISSVANLLEVCFRVASCGFPWLSEDFCCDHTGNPPPPCSAVILHRWIFSLSLYVTCAKRTQGHREFPQGPPAGPPGLSGRSGPQRPLRPLRKDASIVSVTNTAA